jgi:hypothetical protein
VFTGNAAPNAGIQVVSSGGQGILNLDPHMFNMMQQMYAFVQSTPGMMNAFLNAPQGGLPHVAPVSSSGVPSAVPPGVLPTGTPLVSVQPSSVDPSLVARQQPPVQDSQQQRSGADAAASPQNGGPSPLVPSASGGQREDTVDDDGEVDEENEADEPENKKKKTTDKKPE